jgi:hypothetical protein
MKPIGLVSYGNVKLMKGQETGELLAVTLLCPLGDSGISRNRFFELFVWQREISMCVSHLHDIKFKLTCMAPEQGIEGYTDKVEVYSFEMFLFKVMVGERVFPSTAMLFEICDAVREGPQPPIPDWMAGWVHKLIEACQSTDLDVRPSFEVIMETLGRHISFFMNRMM